MKNMERKAEEMIQRAFPGLPVTEIKFLVQSGDIHNYSEDRLLCRENSIEETFYIVLDGEVKVTKVINDDETRHLKSLYPGEFFGEMALIHDAPRAASVITTKPATVLEVNRRAFGELLKKSSTIAISMMREVSRRLRENDEMAIEDLRMKAGELAFAYQRLAEEDLARKELLSRISHDLRKPLISANGFVAMAQKGLLEGDMLRASINTLSQNLEQIILLVNDILFLQEIDLILGEFVPVDIGRVVVHAVENKHQVASNSNVGLSVNIAPNLSRIFGDERSLQHALEVVIDNAIKFSPDGGQVAINAREDIESVTIEVIDSGFGIPDAAIDRIFDRFFHLDAVEEYVSGSVGLGLAVVKQVVNQHNGKIIVDSQVNVGSKIVLCFERTISQN